MFADFQELSTVPWAELIRARTADERGRAALEAVSRATATIGVRPVRIALQRAAAGIAARQTLRPENAGPAPTAPVELDGELLRLAADIDEQCGTMWRSLWVARHLGPRPHHLWFDPADPERDRQTLTVEEVGLLGSISRFAAAAGLPAVEGAAQTALSDAAESDRIE